MKCRLNVKGRVRKGCIAERKKVFLVTEDAIGLSTVGVEEDQGCGGKKGGSKPHDLFVEALKCLAG